jgi:hypothetical protein
MDQKIFGNGLTKVYKDNAHSFFVEALSNLPRTLASLRDTLSSHLMRGKIRVKVE